MPVDVPPSVLEPLLRAGVLGVVIIGLSWVALRLWNKVDALMSAREADWKEHSAEKLKAFETIERLTHTISAMNDMAEQRWRITEGGFEIVRATAKMVEGSHAEVTRIGRLVDKNTTRIGMLIHDKGEDLD